MAIAQASNTVLAKGSGTWQSSNAKVEVKEGSDYFLFNAVRNIALIPAKLIYWNSAYGSGNVSPAVVDKVTQCLEDYGLQNVAVQVNDYSPGWYASRVFTNPKTSLLAKLVFGVPAVIVNVLGLTKILSYDHYDVFSNSIYVISNDPDVALLEAGSAKCFNESNAPALDFAIPVILYPISLVSIPLAAGCKLALNHAGHDASMDWAKKNSTPEELIRTYTVQNPIASAPLISLAGALTAIFAGAVLWSQGIKDPLFGVFMESGVALATPFAILGHTNGQARQMRQAEKLSA